jgi:hypothetical protein
MHPVVGRGLQPTDRVHAPRTGLDRLRFSLVVPQTLALVCPMDFSLNDYLSHKLPLIWPFPYSSIRPLTFPFAAPVRCARSLPSRPAELLRITSCLVVVIICLTAAAP